MFTLQNNLSEKKVVPPSFYDLSIGQIFETVEGTIYMKVSENVSDNALRPVKMINGSYSWEEETINAKATVYPIDYTITLNKRMV
jgi:hypothetical protein